MMRYKFFSLILLMLLFLWSCQSSEEKLHVALQGKLINYLQDQQFLQNGSVHIDSCIILDVDTIDTHAFDSVMLSRIRDRRAYYDSMADAFLKNGNIYNHEAFDFQKAGDLAAFNLAILNATDSHYKAGNFIDSSMAIQRTAEYLRSKTRIPNDTTRFLQADVFLKATFFTPVDSLKVTDTVLYHFNKSGDVIDVNKKLDEMITYDF
jgi:hypothetical protein